MPSGARNSSPCYLWGGYRERRTRLYTAVPDGRIRDNRHKLHQEIQTGYKENLPLQGQSGSGTGCPERSCGLCPQTISRSGCIKP